MGHGLTFHSIFQYLINDKNYSDYIQEKNLTHFYHPHHLLSVYL